MVIDCIIWIYLIVWEGKVLFYISYKVYVFWLIDLIKKEGWKYVEEYVGYFRFMYIVV